MKEMKQSNASSVIQYLVAILVFSIVSYFMMIRVFKSTSNDSVIKVEHKINDLQSSIEVLQRKHDSLMDLADQIETNNAYLSDMILDNSYKIEQYNKELVKIKKQYDEKIRRIDNYTITDLDSIFASRYKWKLQE